MPLALGEVLVVIAIVLVIYGLLYLFARRPLARGMKHAMDDVDEDDEYIKKTFKKKTL